MFERAASDAYAPFLDVLARHPGVRIALHLSGPLLEWLEDRRPDVVDRVGTLVARGQVEPLTGAYYEPILPAISDEDRVGQILKLTERLQRRFGRRPRGMWVAERVWEPELAGSLARAGIRYTFLDDAHFLAAGLPPESLSGPFLTEDLGRGIAVFPMAKALRYLVPFRPPEEALAWLLERGNAWPGGTVTLGDDGEKFGLWPKTHESVYGEGWLDRFMALLEERSDAVRLLFPSTVLDESPPRERVYLPSAAYEEMMEWTLPAAIAPAYAALKERLSRDGEPAAPLLRGGHWRTYLARYPEADHMHKRVLALREEAEGIRARDPEAYRAALDSLWSAQCNCAYWHGVFGGVYLPHLRDAVYRGILAGEEAVERARRGSDPWAAVERRDLDADGEDEILLRTDELTLVASPARGGALVEVSARRERLALGNGLTRRPEAYHSRIADAMTAAGNGDGARSIHDQLRAKEDGLAGRVVVDRYPRLSLLDHVLAPEADLDSFRRGALPEAGGFAVSPYRGAVAGGAAVGIVVLRRTAPLGDGGVLTVEKEIEARGGARAFEVRYRLVNAGTTPLSFRFGVEWNLSMLEGASAARGYRFDEAPDTALRLDSVGETRDTGELVLFDRDRGFEVAIRFSRPATVWRAPVETVSLSEEGLERIYQSSALLPYWTVSVPPGEMWPLGFRFSVAAAR